MLSYPTGNEFVALSHLSAEDAALYACNLVSSSHRGMLQLVGDAEYSSPFLNPVIFYKKKRVNITKIHWDQEKYWIPVGTVTAGDLAIKIRYVAPPRQKSFAVIVDVASTSEDKVNPDDLLIALIGKVGPVEHHTRSLKGERTMKPTPRQIGLLFEFAEIQSPISFCLSSSNKQWVARWAGKEAVPETYAGISKLGQMSGQCDATERETLNFCLAAPPDSAPHGATMGFYIGFGVHHFAAASAALHLDRMGPTQIIEATHARLDQITMQAADPVVQKHVNRNGMFCHYYSTGRTYDKEEFVCMASRHPGYHVTAAYWDRDALFWTFPCILQQDRLLACELLEYAFTTQLYNCGTQSRYIDGTLLTPGMELDQLCAPVIELVHYLRFSNDFDFARRPVIQAGIQELRQRMMGLKCKNAFLFRTFLTSTDDVAPYPVLTFMNVLAWRFFFDLAYIDEKVNASGARSTENRNCALRLRREIYTHCIRNIEGRDVFAYCVPIDGESVQYDPLYPNRETQDIMASGFYDDPLASLVTLPYWGFCKYYDPVYEDTVRLLLSSKYKLAHTGERFDFAGGYRFKKVTGPYVASIANQLLVRINQQKIRDLLEDMPLDNGLACATMNPKTGNVEEGHGMASMAGFWAYAMYRGLAKVAAFGLPPATADEIARTEGAIRKAALEAGLPYPRPHVPSTEDSSAPPRKSFARAATAEAGVRTASRSSAPGVYRGTPTPTDIPDDIGNRLPGASRGSSRYHDDDEISR